MSVKSSAKALERLDRYNARLIKKGHKPQVTSDMIVEAFRKKWEKQ